MERTRRAMQVVGLDGQETDAIFRVVAGIMHCGNIQFGSSVHSALILVGLKRFNRASCLQVRSFCASSVSWLKLCSQMAETLLS